jgi:hypothetical protein
VPARRFNKTIDSTAPGGAFFARRGTLDSGAQHRSSRRVQRMPLAVSWPIQQWALAPPPSTAS